MRRRAALAAGALAALLVAGCAGPRRLADTAAAPPTAPRREHWSGRLSLRVENDAAQNFSALFDLRGDARAGELALSTPLGNMLALLRWAPGEALLREGGRSRQFDSVDALIHAATGAQVPIGALFEWLAGRPGDVPGWRADLSQIGEGRLQAVRESPLPATELRVVFDTP